MPKTSLLILLLLLVAGGLFFFYGSREKTTTDTDISKLGHYLFFDTRLSFNNTKSCVSCHAPQFAFTDGYRRSITATGDNVLHNAPTLINATRNHYFDLADYRVTSLEQQHQRPLFNTHPIELGATGNETLILQRLQKDTLYQRLFSSAFPTVSQPFTWDNIIRSLATYVNTLQSTHSPFDKYIQGDSLAISTEARAGWKLFNSHHLQCGNCHSGTYLSIASVSRNIDSVYYNTGLYNINNSNHYPANDRGLMAISGKATDDGRFRVPTLRNIALTAPYMHDGSVATLPEVIDIYARGGRLISGEPQSGDGALNTHKSKLIKGFTISPIEKQQLLAFLYTLTDSTLFTNPTFQNPFAQTNY